MRTDGVTFIVPVANQELLLPRTLRSALRGCAALRTEQRDGEVLVLDEGSRDGSPVLLRQLEALYHDQGLRVPIEGRSAVRRAGKGAARNAALELAAFRYVVYLECGLEVVPENIVAFHRTARATQAALVFGNVLIEHGTGLDLRGQESFLPQLFNRNHIDEPYLVDALQLKDCGPWCDDPAAEHPDWELCLHLATCGRRLVHVPLVFSIRHGGPVRDSGGSGEQLQRVYNPEPDLRARIPLRTRHLRYHPDVGYL
jgi:glycosyltransferase involved in cell wall biosynthesis